MTIQNTSENRNMYTICRDQNKIRLQVHMKTEANGKKTAHKKQHLQYDLSQINRE